MINGLISSMVGGLSSMVDAVMTWLLQMLGLNLQFFVDAFPVLKTLYAIVQGVAIGLCVAIAIWQLFKYFTGPLAEVNSNPLEIALRLVFALALIWFGNYFLELIINLISYPYVAMQNVNVMEGGTNAFGSPFTKIMTESAMLIPGLAGSLLSFILVILVGWNAIKLALEIVERFLMVGVLTYLSPLAWSTFSSKNTQSILVKYLSMFMGQGVLMLLNVWSIKMMLSVLNPDTGMNVFLSCILALAFCKVAQRFDSYLQTLGINAAHTGGNLIDDVMVAGSSLLKSSKGAMAGYLAGSGDSALGGVIGKNGFVGGMAYKFGNANTPSSSETAASTLNGIPHVEKGQESGIFKNLEGGYSWIDRNGNLYSGRNEETVAGIQAAVRNGYAQYNGESDIGRDDKGNYTWTDANGNEHTAHSLTEMTSIQSSARANYGDNIMPKGQESAITQNSDGTYSWTDRSGNTYNAQTLEEMKTQQATVRNGYMELQGQETDIMKNPDGSYSWTDKDGNNYTAATYQEINAARQHVQSQYPNNGTSPNSNMRYYNSTQDAINRYVTKDGQFVSGQTKIDPSGKEVINIAAGASAAHVISELSSKQAMAGSAGSQAISNIKADTILSHDNSTAHALMKSNINGGIQDSAVVGATYQKLFGDKPTPNGVDNIVPGLTDAVSGNGQAGTITELSMNNGEISGIYQHDDMAEQFSIRNEDSYQSLSSEEQANYHAFEGADGQTYYADSTEVEMSGVESQSMDEAVEMSSATEMSGDVPNDIGNVATEVSSDIPSEVGDSGNITSPESSDNVENVAEEMSAEQASSIPSDVPSTSQTSTEGEHFYQEKGTPVVSDMVIDDTNIGEGNSQVKDSVTETVKDTTSERTSGTTQNVSGGVSKEGTVEINNTQSESTSTISKESVHSSSSESKSVSELEKHSIGKEFKGNGNSHITQNKENFYTNNGDVKLGETKIDNKHHLGNKPNNKGKNK